MTPVLVTVVSHRLTAAPARLTVDHALAALPDADVTVLDLDGTYVPGGAEQVVSPDHIGVGPAELGLALAVLPLDELERRAHAVLLARRADASATRLALAPGMLLLRPPAPLTDGAVPLRVVARTRPETPDGLWPQAPDAARHGAYHPGLVALGDQPGPVLALWRGTSAATAPLWLPVDAREDGDRWLDVAVATVEHHVLHEPSIVLSAWTVASTDTITVGPGAEHPDGSAPALLLDGREVVALDLTAFDPDRPWLLAPGDGRNPRARLSEHPALASVVADLAARLRGARPTAAGTPGGLRTSFGVELHDTLRETYRDALRSADGGDSLPPDPFDPALAAESLAWLTEPGPGGAPGRYLATIRRSRPDLRAAFPGVPGEHTEAFLAWVRDHGRTESPYDARILDAALERHTLEPQPQEEEPPVEGVAVVGFLRGELGIGESARQMAAALAAAHVPVRTVPVADYLSSRQSASYPAGTTAGRMSTTLLCVNADLTPGVSATVPGLLRGSSHRIGMWYWEVEAFPESQHVGFEHVDEVWVASDFVRDAIAPHSPVPVHTVTPPLPQRGPEPRIGRAELGLPDAPVFLFSFDFLSTVERKNPEDLVAAFVRAFGPEDGPVLVLKSINADQRPDEAERLRLRAAGLPHVRLMEGYLDAEQRDALVAACDCYVSLHRSEGLGLTMAEAMAWGKPVIATGYSGNLQFMTEENSFLVPWSPAPIPQGAEPYPAGTTWAQPDLTEAARLMRLVVEQPAEARRRGDRAARDIADRHNPVVAGERAAERLRRIDRRDPATQPTDAAPRRRGLEAIGRASRVGRRAADAVRRQTRRGAPR